MELNREHIVKALECCENTENIMSCQDCPYYRNHGTNGCHTDLIGNALALIRELTEENGRLRGESENQSVLWKQHFESIYETAKETVKADTVRKMQDFLKKVLHKDTHKAIDQIAKEMLEEGSDDEQR